MAGWIKMPLGREVGLSPSDIVLDGNPTPLPKFSAHVCCGQMAGWIKMPLGMDIVLGPGHIVLDDDPQLPFPKGAQPLNFRPISVVAEWLDGSTYHLVGR